MIYNKTHKPQKQWIPMKTIKAYILSLSMMTIISLPLLTTSNPPPLKYLTTNALIKTILNCSLGESLSQLAPDKVPDDVIEFLRQALIQRYKALLLSITKSCRSTTLAEHRNEVHSVAFSPDGKFALTGFKHGTARLWNIVEPLISMRSLTLPITLSIIKLDQNAQDNNHYLEIFNRCDDQQLKKAIMTYFKRKLMTASSSNSN
jgi:WD40 repeat protein